MAKIVFASSNAGKCREITSKLGNSFEVCLQADLGVPDVEETGLTFVENSILKARNACKHTGMAAIADDSGLVVNELNGAPGLYSARYSGPKCDPKENIKLLLQNMNGVKDREAHFYCAMVYLRSYEDPAPKVVTCSWHGTILEQETGSDGFGYDPIFFVPTHNLSAAELDIEVKNKISHRGQAVDQIVKFLLRED